MALEGFALLKWTTKGGQQRGVDLKEEVRWRMNRGWRLLVKFAKGKMHPFESQGD